MFFGGSDLHSPRRPAEKETGEKAQAEARERAEFEEAATSGSCERKLRQILAAYRDGLGEQQQLRQKLEAADAEKARITTTDLTELKKILAEHGDLTFAIEFRLGQIERTEAALCARLGVDYSNIKRELCFRHGRLRKSLPLKVKELDQAVSFLPPFTAVFRGLSKDRISASRVPPSCSTQLKYWRRVLPRSTLLIPHQKVKTSKFILL